MRLFGGEKPVENRKWGIMVATGVGGGGVGFDMKEGGDV